MESFGLTSQRSYAVVPSSEEDIAAYHDTKRIRKPDRSYSNPLILVLCALIAVTSSAVAGFGMGIWMERGKESLPSWTDSLPRVDFSSTKQSFHYNRTFAIAPSDDQSTENAWNELVPQGQGFVRYPTRNSPIRTVSAVHQLHCLYSIRRAYYLAIDGRPAKTDDTKPPHMRHCFDYLRQGLMCAADSSLEPQVPQLGGATGWGFPRRCYGYEELKEWAARWRANDGNGFP